MESGPAKPRPTRRGFVLSKEDLMPKISTFLTFDRQAEDAARFYTSIFPHSKINLWGVFEAKTSWFAYDGKFSLTRMDE